MLLFPENGIEARDDFAVAHISAVDGSGWARSLYSERLADVTSALGIKHTLRARWQGGVLEAFFDGHPISPVRLGNSGGTAAASGGGYLGLLTYGLTSAAAPRTTFSNLNFTSLAIADAALPPFDSSLPSKLGTAWTGIDMGVAPAGGGAPGTSPAVLLPSTGEVLVGAGDGAIIASSDHGWTWRKLPCGGRQYGNGACGSFSLRGNNLHNNLTHVEGYSVSVHRPDASGNQTTPFQLHRTQSSDGINWGAPETVANITLAQLEAAVCTGISPRTQGAEMGACLGKMRRRPDGSSKLDDWNPDPGMRLELPDGTQIWHFGFSGGCKIVAVNGRNYWGECNNAVSVLPPSRSFCS